MCDYISSGNEMKLLLAGITQVIYRMWFSIFRNLIHMRDSVPLFGQSVCELSLHWKLRISGSLLFLDCIWFLQQKMCFFHVHCPSQEISKLLFSLDKWVSLLLPKLAISTSHIVGNQQSRDEHSGYDFASESGVGIHSALSLHVICMVPWSY